MIGIQTRILLMVIIAGSPGIAFADNPSVEPAESPSRSSAFISLIGAMPSHETRVETLKKGPDRLRSDSRHKPSDSVIRRLIEPDFIRDSWSPRVGLTQLFQVNARAHEIQNPVARLAEFLLSERRGPLGYNEHVVDQYQTLTEFLFERELSELERMIGRMPKPAGKAATSGIAVLQVCNLAHNAYLSRSHASVRALGSQHGFSLSVMITPTKWRGDTPRLPHGLEGGFLQYASKF